MSDVGIQPESFSPEMLALLPLFYVGWSDSVLSPSEMKLIHKEIKKYDFLSAEEKSYLVKWTNPKSPPSKELFQFWVSTIKKHATNLDVDDKTSLADICYEIATKAVRSEDMLSERPMIKQSLLDMEKALGLDNMGSLNLLLDKMEIERSPDSEQYSFSVKELRAALDGDKKETKDRIKKLLEDDFFRYQELRDKEDQRDNTLAIVKALADQGLGAYAFPTEYGGGERMGEHITVFETLGYGDLSVLIKFGVQFGLFGGAVYGLGTEKHHRLYLEPLGKAELLGCFAMTETGHGSNVAGLETTATYNHDKKSIIVHSPRHESGKEYIGNAMHSSMAAVFAQLIVDGESKGVHAVLVPLRDTSGNLLPGVTVKDNGYKMGLNGVDNGRIWFDQVEVPVDNLLDKFGGINHAGAYVSAIEKSSKRFFTMLGALVVGRICVGLAAVNVSKVGLTIAIRYAMKRRQFSGKKKTDEMIIMDYPTHQRRLIPLLAKTYAYYISLQKLGEDYVVASEEDVRKIETKAAGLKSMATWHNTRTLQECREACGGKGFLAENRFADLKGDSDIFTTFEGDNTVLLQLVAKGLLTEFKQSFHDEGFRAVVRYLGSRIANTIAEFNPYYARMTSVEHILDPDFHAHALRYREKKQLITLSKRMQEYLKKKIHPHDAFLKCQVHMVDLGKAYIERLAYRDFSKFIDVHKDASHAKIMGKVKALYALTIIEENKGWFLETGYLEGSKTKAIRRVVNKLCQELRPELRGLTDAFGISDKLLGAEIIQGI